MKHVLAMLLGLTLVSAAYAIDTDKAFDDPELQARYERLIAEVRCVTCQNQNVRDSNAFIASDLRREIRRLLGEGKSNDEVVDFLVTRYGDFVLYRPRSSGKMLMIWIAPFALLLLAVFGIVRVVRHRMRLPIGDDAADDRSRP